MAQIVLLLVPLFPPDTVVPKVPFAGAQRGVRVGLGVKVVRRVGVDVFVGVPVAVQVGVGVKVIPVPQLK